MDIEIVLTKKEAAEKIGLILIEELFDAASEQRRLARAKLRIDSVDWKEYGATVTIVVTDKPDTAVASGD